MARPMAASLSPLAGLAFISPSEALEIADAGPAARLIYRGPPEELNGSFGVALPSGPCRAALSAGFTALWLGPDEWLLLGPAGEQTRLLAARSGLSGERASLTDISDRHFGLIVSGLRCPDLLAAGCPLDLDLLAFPIGMCVRTLFGKCEIILWRTAVQTFRLEAWRSFAPYLAGLLNEAAAQLPHTERTQ
jgi:sarcosine oxidase, subunit gamma